MNKAHVHEFELATEKVRVRRADPVKRRFGRISAIDLMKQRVCACGKVETYDFERMVV